MTFWPCPLCKFFGTKLIRVLNHVEKMHPEPDSTILCGVDGCCHTFEVVNSYRRHLYRNHREHIEPSSRGVSGPDVVERAGPDGNLPDGQESSNHQLEDEARTTPVSPSEMPAETFQEFVQSLQENICSFFFQLAEKHKVPYTTCDKIFSDFQCLLELILNKHAQQIKQATSVADVSTDSHGPFGGNFPRCLFDKVRSGYQREQYARKNFLYVKPEEHLLPSPQSSSFQYIPIGKVIQNLFEVPELANNLLQPSKQVGTTPEVLRCFRDGTASKQVAVNANASQPVHNLHLVLYTDELGITNPLGPNQKRHKLLVVYFSLLDLHPRYRASLKHIHLTLMAKYQDTENDGLEKVLQPLLHDLAELKSNGLQVRSGEGTMTVKVMVAAVCGDNLSLNKLGGFSCCFSSGRVCRFCMASKARLAELTREELCVIRSAAGHSIHLSAIAINPSLRKHYGVTGPSPMLSLEDFDVTRQLMPDIMHDMFEGGFAVVLHHVLQGLIEEGTLALTDFDKVARFKVGFNDRKNKPEPLHGNFAKDHRALKGTASQKWCLFRLLPLMLASNIPEGNEHWEVYLKYREITDMILAPEVPIDFLPYLEDRIQGFLRNFSEVYPSASVTPKLHHLVHYPRIIREYGPLQNYWCMRYEAKHQYFKSLATKTKNFVNITKTLSTRHQLLQSYELHTFVLDKPVYASGLKAVTPAALNQCAESLASHGRVWEAKSIETSTGVYRTNDVLVMDKTTSLSFAEVSTVYMVNGKVFLLLNELQVERFRRHKCSYRVQRTDHFYLKQPGEEACFQRLDLYNDGELVPKWDTFFYP